MFTFNATEQINEVSRGGFFKNLSSQTIVHKQLGMS